MGCWNSRHGHLDRSLHNLLYDSLPHLSLSLERFKPVKVIQTAGRFSDKSWLHYDIAFRKEAAASDSTNWSCMHPDLYNFHTRSPATTSVASGSSTFSALSLTESPASSGNCQSSQYWAGLLLYLLRSRVCQVLVIWLFLRLPPASSPSSEADLGEGLRGLQPPFG